MSKFKLISWNVNGLRAIYKKGFLDFLKKESPDFLCLQETKANEDQLPFDIKIIDGYTSFFSSALKKGYSGTAIYAKDSPLSFSNSINSEKDNEGRSIILEYEKFILLNVYFPNGQASKERLDYKLKYYEDFLKKLKELEKKNKMIIFCGDVNTAHNEIDLSRPKENSKRSGFLIEERKYLDLFIKNGYLDTFRLFNKEPNNYTWWDMKTRARDRNIGWRIDYFFASKKYIKNIKNASILKDVYGSDHAPILLEIDI